MRFRRPSLRTLLGATRATRRFKRDVGMYDNPMWKATHAVPNARRRVLRRAGYYSEPMKWFRWFRK